MHGSRNATTTGAASTRGALRRPTRVLLAFRVWSGVGRRGGEGGLDEWRSGRAGSVVVRVRGFQANRRTTLTMRCAEPALLAWLRGVWSTRSDAASPRRGLLAAPAVPVAVEEEDEAEAEDEAEEADDDDGRGGTSGAPQSSQNAFEWCRFCASTADSLKPFGAAARGGGGGVPNAEPAQLRSLVRCAMVAAVVWPRRQVGACKVPRRESRQARPVLAIPETSSRPPLLVTVSVVRAPTRCAAAQLSVPLRPLAPLSNRRPALPLPAALAPIERPCAGRMAGAHARSGRFPVLVRIGMHSRGARQSRSVSGGPARGRARGVESVGRLPPEYHPAPYPRGPHARAAPGLAFPVDWQRDLRAVARLLALRQAQLRRVGFVGWKQPSRRLAGLWFRA